LGKTSLALQMALRAAQEAAVAFFSVEMSRGPLGLRAAAGEARVDGYRLRNGWATDVELQRVGQALTDLAELPIYLDESPMLSPLQLRSKLRRLRSRVGALGLVVVDYLQLMAPLPEHRRENKTNQVAGISRALKLMAREFAVPFLVLAQLNRGLERAADKVPTMADLRDSGALEQDADIVLLLHRPEAFEREKKPELEGVAQLIVAKFRNGATGTVDLRWRKEITRFEDVR
jgi:replicative DNA helicase